GLTLDGEGKVWVAMHSGHQVLGLDEHGQVAEKIAVGARQVTACTFGGPDRSTLFITTSRENLPEGEDPAAGSLFSAQPGVRGAALRRLRARPPRQRTCGPHLPDPSARPEDPSMPLPCLPSARAPSGSPFCALAWWATGLVLALSALLLVEPSAQLYLAVAQS